MRRSRLITPSKLSLLSISPVIGAWWEELLAQKLFEASKPAMWRKFNAGVDGSAWHLMRMHRELVDRLPKSPSVDLLGEAVDEILSSNAYQQLIPMGSTTETWNNTYPESNAERNEPNHAEITRSGDGT